MEPVIVVQAADDGTSGPVSSAEPEGRFSHLPEPVHPPIEIATFK